MTAPTVVVIDAMDDLASTLALVEDWLRWCTPRTDDGADRLDIGATAAAALSNALHHSRRVVVTRYGAELAPVCFLPGDVSSLVSAVRAAAAEPDEPGPAGGTAAIAVLHRCCQHAGRPESRRLASLGFRTSSDQPLVVDDAGLLAYRRLVAATIRDPLDAFAALPELPATTLSTGIDW